jgi:hypothetical protein
VAFVLSAPGLDPALTVFSATHLPSGAELDPATGAFQWKPAPDESGLVLPPVRFAATDGVASVAEDVALDVTEAVSALGGTVRLAGGTPLAGAVIRIIGGAGGPHFVRTDAAGRFRFFAGAPGTYRARLDNPTKKEYRATPSALSIIVGNGDVLGADFVVTPR